MLAIYCKELRSYFINAVGYVYSGIFLALAALVCCFTTLKSSSYATSAYFTYMIESEVGVDIRKNLFYTLAEKNWPMIGLEALGMNLEDIFITIVDKTDARKALGTKSGKVSLKGKSASIEKEVAQSIMDKTARAQATSSITKSKDEDHPAQ